MTDVIKFYAKGNPKGQPRPRAFAINGKARIYDAGTAEGWKSQVAIAAQSFIPIHPLTGAIGVEITFNMPRPKSHYRTGKNAGQLKQDAPWFYDKKPDIDNLEKAIYDALTTIGMWQDDCQIVSATVRKFYAVQGFEGAEIEIFSLQKKQDDSTSVSEVIHSPIESIPPGDGNNLFIGNYLGTDSVFQRTEQGAIYLHKAEPIDLQTLPRN